MIPTLSRHVSSAARGNAAGLARPFTHVGFLLGAWAVLFKTLYVATAANSRLTADFLHRLGVWNPASPAERERLVKLFCVLYPTLSLGLYYAFREPQGLIKAGGIAQALMLPFIAGATIYLRQRDTDRRVGPSIPLRDILTWIAFFSIIGRRGLQHVRPVSRATRQTSRTIPARSRIMARLHSYVCLLQRDTSRFRRSARRCLVLLGAGRASE